MGSKKYWPFSFGKEVSIYYWYIDWDCVTLLKRMLYPESLCIGWDRNSLWTLLDRNLFFIVFVQWEWGVNRRVQPQDLPEIWQDFHQFLFSFETFYIVSGYESVKVLAAQSGPIVCDPMDCSPPGSSIHGILQARILEWVAIPFSSRPSQPRDGT